MKYLISLFYLLILFNYSKLGIIIPDKENPLILVNPAINEGTSTLVLNFKLSEGGKGLEYKQFIAVRFPASDSTVLNLGTKHFQFNTANSASCTLYKDTSTKIRVSFVQSTSSKEANICYCQLIETKPGSDLLPLNSKINYRLEIKLHNLSQKPTAIFWRNLDIFTITSNHLDAYIIDTGYSFGSASVLPNYNTFKYNILAIQAISKVDQDDKDNQTQTGN